MRRLACESCKRAIARTDIDQRLGTATCGGCGAVWTLDGDREPRPAEPDPGRWTTTVEGTQLLLRHRWFGWTALFLVLWCGFWDLGMIAMWGGWLGGAREPSAALPLVPHSLIGLAMTWYMLASLLNTTEIRVGGGRLRLAHGPVPWPGGVEISRDDIQQLFVQESSVAVNRRATYNLIWVDRAGISRVLVRWMRSVSEARWLEQQIEERWEIEDRRVGGEA